MNLVAQVMFKIKSVQAPGTVAHTYNPSILGGQCGQITWGHEFEASLDNMVKAHLYQKYKKLAGCGGMCL